MTRNDKAVLGQAAAASGFSLDFRKPALCSMTASDRALRTDNLTKEVTTMTTQNNPENQNITPLLGSGQITDNPLPWVIVEMAGTDDESIYSDHATYRAAIQHAIEFLGAEFYEDGFDIMRRRDDGVLTTEF